MAEQSHTTTAHTENQTSDSRVAYDYINEIDHLILTCRVLMRANNDLSGSLGPSEAEAEAARLLDMWDDQAKCLIELRDQYEEARAGEKTDA